MLDVDLIVQEAESLVDATGWDALTMAALGGRLGVRVPSLYSHVAGLEYVRARLQERFVAALGRELQLAAMGRVGNEALRAMVLVYRGYGLAHPHRYDGLTRRPIDRDSFHCAALAAEEALRLGLRGLEFDEQQTMDAQLSIFAIAHGFVSLEIAGYWANLADSERLCVEAIDRMVLSLHRDKEPVA